MRKPYLIQKAEAVNSNRGGIDSLLSFSYMGSAEFEFGALPKSLKRIRHNLNQYVLSSFRVSGKKFKLFCKVDEKDSAIESINEMAEKGNRYYSKESIDLKEYIDGNESKYSKADHWWDIENDFMFWKSRKEFNKNLIDAIKTAPKEA